MLELYVDYAFHNVLHQHTNRSTCADLITKTRRLNKDLFGCVHQLQKTTQTLFLSFSLYPYISARQPIFAEQRPNGTRNIFNSQKALWVIIYGHIYPLAVTSEYPSGVIWKWQTPFNSAPTKSSLVFLIFMALYYPSRRSHWLIFFRGKIDGNFLKWLLNCSRRNYRIALCSINPLFLSSFIIGDPDLTSFSLVE